jgi:transcriptional regulator with XRE-family HTH domain
MSVSRTRWCEAVGTVLAARKKELGLSLSEVGSLSGIEPSHLSVYFNGRRLPSLPTLSRLGLALEWDTAEMMQLFEAELCSELAAE